jgi:hypothetical protein
MSAISAFSASTGGARNSTRSRSADRRRERIDRRDHRPRPSPPTVVDAVETLVDTYLGLRGTTWSNAGLDRCAQPSPQKDDLAGVDPAGMLWMSDTDACCHIRKVLPLEKALNGFRLDIWPQTFPERNAGLASCSRSTKDG